MWATLAVLDHKWAMLVWFLQLFLLWEFPKFIPKPNVFWHFQCFFVFISFLRWFICTNSVLVSISLCLHFSISMLIFVDARVFRFRNSQGMIDEQLHESNHKDEIEHAYQKATQLKDEPTTENTSIVATQRNPKERQRIKAKRDYE